LEELHTFDTAFLFILAANIFFWYHE